MTRVEANKAIARRAIGQMGNRWSLNAIDKLHAMDYMTRDIVPGINPNWDAYRQWGVDPCSRKPYGRGGKP